MSLNKKVPKEVSKGESVVCLAPAMQATLKIKVCLPPASIAIRRFAALCNTPVPPPGRFIAGAVFVLPRKKRRIESTNPP